MKHRNNKETFAYELALSVQLASEVIAEFCNKAGITKDHMPPRDLSLYLESEAINRLTTVGDENV